MMKKKAIKIASATTIAASAFVATAPVSAASNSVENVVSQAVSQMKQAYYMYSNASENGGFANISDIYVQYNNAKKQYFAAKAMTIKAGGAQLDARLALLDTTYNEYIAKRVITYIDAYNYAVELSHKTADLKAAIQAVDLDKSTLLYHAVSGELNSRTVILDRVYGKSTRDLLRSTYKKEAEDVVKSIRVDITVKMAVDEANEALKVNNLPAANTAIDKANQNANGLDNNAFGQAIADQLKIVKDKYESLLDPVVTSVAPLNAKQVQVNFNTELNSDTSLAGDASEASLYTIDGVSPQSAVLSDSKKSVTLTFASSIEGKDQVVVINPILTNKKDGDNNLVKTAKYSEILSYKDTVKPTIVGTEYKNGKIIVSFSENIGTLPTVVRVNGNPVGASDLAIDSADRSKLEISYAGLPASKEATLFIAGAKDSSMAENEMDFYNGKFVTPSADTSKPMITSIQVTGQNKAKVTLSEAINESSFSATLQKDATQHAVTLVRDPEDKTGKTYTLTVDLNGSDPGDGIFADKSDSATFTLYVAAGAMTDTATPANASDAYSAAITFSRDTTPPAFVASQVSDDKQKLEFKFNDHLTVAGSDSNIVIRNSDGVNFPVVATETGLKSGDDETFQVDPKAGDVAIDPGTYTVTIPAGFFTDENGNPTTAVTSTFTVLPSQPVDNVKPTASVMNVNGMANTFDVTYSEEVTSSAINVANYKLDGQAMPAGTDVSFTGTDKKTVRIVLPANSINFGDQVNGANAILTISGVADKAGNVIDTVNKTVSVKDNTPAHIANVQVIGQDVYVTFNENVTVPTAADAFSVFKVTVNGKDLTATDMGTLSSVVGNPAQVKFTLTNLPATTPEVTVKADQTVLKDVNGVNVK